MRRILPLLTVLLLACQTVYQIQQDITPSQIASATVAATRTSSPEPTFTPKPTSTPTPTPWPYIVRIHPDDGLYVGDLVSFEVVAPEGYEEFLVQIKINSPNGPVFGPAPFYVHGLGDQAVAKFKWVWDTSGMEPSDIIVTFEILDGGPSWDQVIPLYPEDALPPNALNAVWESARSDCCIVHYLSYTSSQRDLQTVMDELDEQAEIVEQIMGVEFNSIPEVVLIPRVIGHGGFATDEIYISYLDRNYAGSSLRQVLLHELFHILDRHAGGKFRPTMLAEGVAVFLSGGHFKPEPLFERAAALLELDWYIPIPDLVDNFYLQQHEIGYLEAGALVEYMVDKWGWTAFDNFYRDIDRPNNHLHSVVIDAALQDHFGITLAELDAQFVAALENAAKDPNFQADVQTTVYFYDTVRRYQQSLDNSAYFLTAWFLEIEELLSVDVTADYLRHPDQTVNITLETMLVAADEYLRVGEYEKSNDIIDAINMVLDRISVGHSKPFKAHPLAADYLAIVKMLIANGYQPQKITLNNNSAQALVTLAGLELIELNLENLDSVWYIE